MSLRRAPFTPRPRPEKSGGNGDAEKLARVDTITKNARGIWFGLLGALVFAGVTLLGVEDIDFFGVDRSTKLPLIGVSVPVTYFFSAGATLVTAFYVYFHLYLVQLWQALGDAPARPKGQPLGHTVHPWLVTDAMIRWRNRMRGDDSAEPRPLALIGIIVTFMLVWLFGLLILGYFWWRSMPAHYEWLTLWLCILLLFAGYIALESIRAAWWYLSNQSKPESRWRWATRPAKIVLTVVLISLSWLKTEGGFEGYAEKYSDWKAKGVKENEDQRYARQKAARNSVLTTEDIAKFSSWLQLSRANLDGAYLTILPSDWRPRDHAEKWFNADWCKREGLGNTCDGINDEQIAEQLEEWQTHRQTYVNTLARPNLKGRDLRYANMNGAFLPNVDLSNARLDEATLSGAWMERVILKKAWMEGTKFIGAHMEGANLHKGWMKGANLSGAQMQSADLSWAWMEKAEFIGARMEEVNFSNAWLKGANLSEAIMKRADLSWVRMEGVILYKTQLEGANLSYARMAGATLQGAGMQKANLKNAQVWAANLVMANMEGANLNQANMMGAILSGTRLEGAELINTQLGGALLAGSEIIINISHPNDWAYRLVAVKNVNFTDSTIRASQIQQMFGDNSVIFPGDLPRPCHWSDQDLQTEVTHWLDDPSRNDLFIGRWRGWVEANGVIWPTSPQFENFRRVIAIPPPSRCPLITEILFETNHGLAP